MDTLGLQRGCDRGILTVADEALATTDCILDFTNDVQGRSSRMLHYLTTFS